MGDVRGDGYPDVFVGMSDRSVVYGYEGSVWGPAVDATWTFRVSGATNLGTSTAAGDVNADGYDELLVGSHRYDGGCTDQGLAAVYLGSATGISTTATWSKSPTQSSCGCSGGAGAPGAALALGAALGLLVRRRRVTG
jgi:MYXO-CTERM domain-containing protein